MLPKYQNIAVAIDFSPLSLTAFARAVKVAKEHNALLHLVSVVDTESFGAIAAYDVKYGEQLKVERTAKVEELKEQALAAGVQHVTTHVEAGSPKVILTKYPADFIILGATGLNRFEKAMLGSVCEKVVRHAKCDVLIVRDEA